MSVEAAFIARDSKAINQRKKFKEISRIKTVVVRNTYELGKIVALRFMEWVDSNPEGIIALPTGRTPEYFIKTLEIYRNGWNDKKIRDEIKLLGFKAHKFPDFSGLKFVMLDEFFPMLPTHRNSFCKYIKNFYAEPLGIKTENILTFDLLEEGILDKNDFAILSKYKAIDLTLLKRSPKNKEETELKNFLNKAQKYCDDYEKKIAELGGIGFFLGGIGPDGHIAFNQQGCDHSCPTRLVNFNYPSAAAAAGDLGGIEIARGKAAMTIGLKTITANPNATIIIMASGERKANVVRAALEDKTDFERPASCLHHHKGARFYITDGAACKLADRKGQLLMQVEDETKEVIEFALSHLSSDHFDGAPHMVAPPKSYTMFEHEIYDAALRLKKTVAELTRDEVAKHGHIESISIMNEKIHKDALAFDILKTCAIKRLKEKIEGGLKDSQPIGHSLLHTAPHHDDIMLSYHGAMHYMLGRDDNNGIPVLAPINTSGRANGSRSPRGGGFGADSFTHGSPSNAGDKRKFHTMIELLGERANGNENHFAYLTSGFHSVSDDYLRAVVLSAMKKGALDEIFNNGGFDPNGKDERGYDDLLGEFRRAFEAGKVESTYWVETAIFLRKLREVGSLESVEEKLEGGEPNYESVWTVERSLEIMNRYLEQRIPGDAVPIPIQLLKGCMRESEVDRVWTLSRMPMSRVHHLRSKFYTDDFFTPMPTLEDDALPVANLIRDRRPNMLSVAFDPEGTGPDTHYKVLLCVAAGLKESKTRGYLDGLPDGYPVVWGYRNVWFRFHPTDASLLIPCTDKDLDLMHDTFMECFTTQKAASFPSPQFDGPFSSWAMQIQKEQFDMIRCLLGNEYFDKHPNERVRNSKGFIFIKAMYMDHFLQEVADLRSKLEV